jgi:hypothetical protein
MHGGDAAAEQQRAAQEVAETDLRPIRNDEGER